jgi:hypothetical protein
MVDNEVTQPALIELSANTKSGPEYPVGATERRRPGRADYGDPALIDLLQGAPSAIKPAEPEADHDDLAPAKGILTGLLMVVPFWAIVGFVVWYF